MHVLSEAHVRYKTASDIWARVTRARADRQEIHILHASAGGFETIQDRATAGFQGTGQITLIQLIRAFLAI